MSTPPAEYFKEFNKEGYSQYDEQGIPTHWIKEVKKGADKGQKKEAPIPDAERNKCVKKLKAHEVKYQKWLESEKAAPKEQEEKKEKKQVETPSTTQAAAPTSSGSQDDQIKALQAQIEKIDAMSREQVYADPIRKIQEEHYAQLLQIREGVYKTVKEAIDTIEGGAASGTETKTGTGSGSDNSEEEKTKLREENKKLNYRIIHLLKALDDLDKKKK